MDEHINLRIDTTALRQNLASAGEEINRIAAEEIAPAAGLIEDAFTGAAQTIEQHLSNAARNGSLSLKSLGRALYVDFRQSLVDNLVRQPIENALNGLFSSAFGGGRAGGGFVAPGQSFLVGERGPEIFTPNQSGMIAPGAAGQAVNVHITLPGVRNSDEFKRSQSQIAASLGRALGRGARNQ